MDPETQQTITYCCGGCCLFFLIIVLIFSWGTVEPTEWGLRYNSISKQIDKETIYDGGRYFLFLFNDFVTFPRILQSIEFSTRKGAQSSPLKTRTAEGLALEIHLAFQYQLIPDQLPDLYALNNVDYEATFVRIARDTILQVAGNYMAPMYWEERTQIGDDMKKQLDIELKKAHADCIYLELMQIVLPSSYEDSIVLTQVEVQNSKMKKFEQDAAIIRQQIDILRSVTDQQVRYTQATAEADAYLMRQTAIANATQNIVNAEAEQYRVIKEALNLNATELNLFVFYNGLMDSGGELFVGFTNNMFVNQNIKS